MYPITLKMKPRSILSHFLIICRMFRVINNGGFIGQSSWKMSQKMYCLCWFIQGYPIVVGQSFSYSRVNFTPKMSTIQVMFWLPAACFVWSIAVASVVEAVGKGGKSGMAAATLFKRWWLSLVPLAVVGGDRDGPLSCAPCEFKLVVDVEPEPLLIWQNLYLTQMGAFVASSIRDWTYNLPT